MATKRTQKRRKADESEDSEGDADEGANQIVVVAQVPRETRFASWEAFEAYFASYQMQSYQVFRCRSTTNAAERNTRIKSLGSKMPQIPDGWVHYARTLVCTHHGKPKRPRRESHATGCRVKINVCVKVVDKVNKKFVVAITKCRLGHNHPLTELVPNSYLPSQTHPSQDPQESRRTEATISTCGTSWDRYRKFREALPIATDICDTMAGFDIDQYQEAVEWLRGMASNLARGDFNRYGGVNTLVNTTESRELLFSSQVDGQPTAAMGVVGASGDSGRHSDHSGQELEYEASRTEQTRDQASMTEIDAPASHENSTSGLSTRENTRYGETRVALNDTARKANPHDGLHEVATGSFRLRERRDDRNSNDTGTENGPNSLQSLCDSSEAASGGFRLRTIRLEKQNLALYEQNAKLFEQNRQHIAYQDEARKKATRQDEMLVGMRKSNAILTTAVREQSQQIIRLKAENARLMVQAHQYKASDVSNIEKE
ncbi:hypothetical protein PHMEG_00019379 [Phytophthora megakarya]|uniref:DUF5575 domain-containing protein n=1 Tax=Phytophthora megakarya TaxID=4795 RepID=A0A225VTK3_9STRA|nr:hypothetical protein PHMEG_00019379 [Phytophthora megakarya]